MMQPMVASAREGYLHEPAPCDDCRFAARCAVALTACEAFSMFVAALPAARWSAAPRAPTRARS